MARSARWASTNSRSATRSPTPPIGALEEAANPQQADGGARGADSAGPPGLSGAPRQPGDGRSRTPHHPRRGRYNQMVRRRDGAARQARGHDARAARRTPAPPGGREGLHRARAADSGARAPGEGSRGALQAAAARGADQATVRAVPAAGAGTPQERWRARHPEAIGRWTELKRQALRAKIPVSDADIAAKVGEEMRALAAHYAQALPPEELRKTLGPAAERAPAGRGGARPVAARPQGAERCVGRVDAEGHPHARGIPPVPPSAGTASGRGSGEGGRKTEPESGRLTPHGR